MISAMDLLNKLTSPQSNDMHEDDKNETIQSLMETFKNQVEIPIFKMTNFVETFITCRANILEMKSKMVAMNRNAKDISESNQQLTNGIAYFTKEHERLVKENVDMKNRLRSIQAKSITIPAPIIPKKEK